ncbi:hypothetical protein LAZ67_8003579 [Cordylochernes scorpioides]|uniref:T20D4.11-like domain-containing protein n=1 Tax=Cordylochernes scorpioides TaxID=51811 RepID=A0ABY6KSD5_9ARAC|nr:hypothetical protein LAZ67_8003579 [Cordylochernes scorpioides]
MVRCVAQNCHWREIELCAATMVLFMQGDSPIPTNEEDLTASCEYIQEATQCLGNYTEKCTTPMVRELMDVFMGDATTQLNEFCTSGSEIRANFLQHSECLAEVYPEERPCFLDLQVTMEKVVDKATTNEDRLPALCCGYNRFNQCVHDLIEPKCGAETVQYSTQMFEMIATTMPRTICSNFKDDRCEQLLPPPGTQPEGMAQNCHWREIELCQATMALFMQGDSPIPTNEEDVSASCEYIQEATQCLGNYTEKCTTPMVRELIDVFMGDSTTQLNEFCTPGSELRANFLQHAECLADVYPEERPCFLDLQATMEKVVNKETANEDRLSILCCGHNRFNQCVHDLIEPKCGAETVQYSTQMFEMIATTMPRTICSNFKDDRCEQLLPPSGTQPEGSQSKSTIARLLAAFLGN